MESERAYKGAERKAHLKLRILRAFNHLTTCMVTACLKSAGDASLVLTLWISDCLL